MSTDGVLVLGRDELESLALTWTDIVDVLEDAFRQKSAGLVQNPPKPAVRPRDDAFINAMPAYLGGSDRVGIKWVAGFEQNRAKGLPYIYGVFVLNDAETGRPLALIDGGWITEMRTAGVSGVVMRQVPDEPRRLAIVGAGVQGRRHAELLLELRPGIEQVRVFDAVPAASEALLALAGDREGVVARDAEHALDGADLVVTVVTVPLEPRLTAANTDPDALLLPVDYDDALGPAAANGATRYVVDDLAQYASVADRHWRGFREPDGELAQVVAGELAVPAAGRRVFLEHGHRDGRRRARRALLRPGARAGRWPQDRVPMSHGVDLERLRLGRLASLQEAMVDHDLEALLLANEPNVRYATGATAMPVYAMSTFARCARRAAAGHADPVRARELRAPVGDARARRAARCTRGSSTTTPPPRPRSGRTRRSPPCQSSAPRASGSPSTGSARRRSSRLLDRGRARATPPPSPSRRGG